MTQTTTFHDLSRTLDGGILLPDDPGAVESATTVTGRGTPDLVARPSTAAQVAAALHHARTHDLPLTIRSGGHSMSGASMASGGLLQDLRRISEVDIEPADRLVRIGGGARWGEVAEALRPYGLGLTAGDTAAVGVGGLTLGGGIGWMVRKHGLAIDNLVGAQVVTADGVIHETSLQEEQDLFWAIRGGGGGVGVVTRFDFRAQEVDDVVFGRVAYAADDTSTILEAWHRAQRVADERLTTTLSLMPAMGGQPAVAVLGLCFAGPVRDSSGVLRPFLELGSVLSNEVGVRPYAGVLEDAHHPVGMRVAMDNALLEGLDEPTIIGLVDLHANGTVVSIRALGGAFGRVPADATAFGHRSAEVMVAAARFSPGPDAPSLTGVDAWLDVTDRGIGSYLNFCSTVTRDVHTPAAAARLARIKAEHDPTGVFGASSPRAGAVAELR